MEEEVFRILRFSYSHLKDSALQQCFLYCALFPPDFMIPRKDLVRYLIDEGIIKGFNSRVAEFDKGYSMLNRLENVCLLESAKRYDDRRCVKMHDLIRDMAIQIQQENSQAMVKAGAQLKELPDVEEWTENLVRVSLIQNQIEEISWSHSANCPNLSTLLLCHNEGLRFIADSFFKQLLGLKVLDLSYSNIADLADSVSDLVSLNALLLEGCVNLRRIPSLKKLRALKRLDLCFTVLEKIPQGMECLSNLRYLRMNGCGQKELPSGILPKLSRLQVLVLEEWMPTESKSIFVPVTVRGKQVGCLRKLETLECHFESHSEFVEYLKYQNENQPLSTYRICVGLQDEDDYNSKWYCRDKSVWFGNLSIKKDGDFQVMSPNGIQEVLCRCIDATSLSDVLSLNYETDLEVINIKECNTMESLVSSSWFSSAPLPFPSDNGIFSSLKDFYCVGCNSMKKLFPHVLLPNLVNLEEIRVEECEKIEEIIGTRSDGEGVIGEESSSTTKFRLPKLRNLRLKDLPELKNIYSAQLICDSLENIDVLDFLTIGIYGIEGLGKTTKLQHIHNELLGRLDISHNVYGVTVSRDFSIDTLQNLIVKRLDLDPSSKDNDRNDLWNPFKLDKVEIPLRLKGCKLILTTLSERASYRMNCRHKIKVMPLSDGEAQTLLMEELGHDIALSPEVEKLQ
uniref:Uncharacterized protein n=1 Tax=Salix viminalis TaxID=40686 RepID=A0A6N2LN04_SALVM